jgi:hypothetical protein
MFNVLIHYGGAGAERRVMPAIPAAGSCLYGPRADSRPWQVEAVVFGGDAGGMGRNRHNQLTNRRKSQ